MSTSLMTPGTARRLTEGERTLAAEVFGAALSTDRIRIFALPVWRRAFAAGPGLVCWPAKGALRDFSRARLGVQAILVHELTHAWQAQTGINLVLAKLKAGDGPAAYHYEPAAGRGFRDFNIEQQAMAVQHAFLASRGGPAPHGAETYALLLSGSPLEAGLKPFKV